MNINEAQSKTMKTVKTHVKKTKSTKNKQNSQNQQKHEKSTENKQIYKSKRTIDKKCTKAEDKQRKSRGTIAEK